MDMKADLSNAKWRSLEAFSAHLDKLAAISSSLESSGVAIHGMAARVPAQAGSSGNAAASSAARLPAPPGLSSPSPSPPPSPDAPATVGQVQALMTMMAAMAVGGAGAADAAARAPRAAARAAAQATCLVCGVLFEGPARVHRMVCEGFKGRPGEPNGCFKGVAERLGQRHVWLIVDGATDQSTLTAEPEDVAQLAVRACDHEAGEGKKKAGKKERKKADKKADKEKKPDTKANQKAEKAELAAKGKVDGEEPATSSSALRQLDSAAGDGCQDVAHPLYTHPIT